MLTKVRPEGLCGVEVGAAARVTGVELPVAPRLRLAGFGIRPGAVVTVLGRTPGGGRLVGIGAGRLALDRRTAASIRVDQAGDHGQAAGAGRPTAGEQVR